MKRVGVPMNINCQKRVGGVFDEKRLPKERARVLGL